MSNQTDEADPFGFTARNTVKEKLSTIRPTPVPSIPDMARIDAAAENVGFVSRESAPAPAAFPGYPLSTAAVARPTLAINMRVPENVAGAFKRFCTENRYSYPEALEEIMMRAGLPVK
jgi:hypothetical protein